MDDQNEKQDPAYQETMESLNAEITSKAESGHDRLVRHKRCLLQARRRKGAAFQQRLYSRWCEALDLYEIVLHMAVQCGAKFNRRFRPLAASTYDVRFEALSRLHGSASLVASEIYQLLLGGFASGAHARWRTLHEIAIVMQFIGQQDPDIAEAFLLHREVKAFEDAKQYQMHSQKLGFRDANPDEVDKLERRASELCQHYGASFRGDYGWAEPAIRKINPSFKGGSIGIKHIEKAVSSEHWNPLYRMANHAVHATSNSIKFNLGGNDYKQLILAGPSNGGLADPGHGSLISLMRATSTLMSCAIRMTPSLDSDANAFSVSSTAWGMVAELKTLAKFVDEAGHAFLAADKQIKKEEGEKPNVNQTL